MVHRITNKRYSWLSKINTTLKFENRFCLLIGTCLPLAAVRSSRYQIIMGCRFVHHRPAVRGGRERFGRKPPWISARRTVASGDPPPVDPEEQRRRNRAGPCHRTRQA